MGIRRSKANPCKKKEIDNHKYSNRCECKIKCDELLSYKSLASVGTQQHREEHKTSNFESCVDIDQYLIDNQLLRLEAREQSGLDVLFSGMQKVQALSADYLELDNLGLLDSPDETMTVAEAIETYSHEVDNTIPIDELDYDEEQDLFDTDPNLYIDESLLEYSLRRSEYKNSFANELFGLAPENLKEVAFNYLLGRGEFDKHGNNVSFVARAFKEKRELPHEVKAIWPKFTEKRFEKAKAQISEITRKKSPFWIKRFDKIWGMLTDNQAEAIKAEFFYEGFEKPTQKESAKRLGISVASYQERLEWAFKKLERLYPEWERVKRRKRS